MIKRETTTRIAVRNCAFRVNSSGMLYESSEVKVGCGAWMRAPILNGVSEPQIAFLIKRMMIVSWLLIANRRLNSAVRRGNRCAWHIASESGHSRLQSINLQTQTFKFQELILISLLNPCHDALGVNTVTRPKLSFTRLVGACEQCDG